MSSRGEPTRSWEHSRGLSRQLTWFVVLIRTAAECNPAVASEDGGPATVGLGTRPPDELEQGLEGKTVAVVGRLVLDPYREVREANERGEVLVACVITGPPRLDVESVALHT